MAGCAMKSEAIGADRIKTEGRQPILRWRMSKIAPIVNGAEDGVGYADDEEIMVKQTNPVNLAAAVHDHISCTKSAELRKTPETKDGRVNLPLTDHMYANYSEKPKGLGIITTMSPIPSEIKDHVRCLEEIVLSQLTLIGKQNETICTYEKKIEELGKELKQGFFALIAQKAQKLLFIDGNINSEEVSPLRQRVDEESEERTSSQKSEDQDNGSTDITVEVTNNLSDTSSQPSVTPSVEKHFYTKCSGRSNSKHPSRSLKRRIFVTDKSALPKSPVPFSSSRPSMSPLQFITDDDDDKTVETNNMKMFKSDPVPSETIIMNFKKPHRKRGRKCRRVTRKIECLLSDEPYFLPGDFLLTDKPYFLPDYYAANSPLSNAETTIDVPSWRHLTVPRFYNMDLPENIDDSVFQKRHNKYETEERRRKKQDLEQQKREMKNRQKLQQKQYRCMGKNSRGKLRKKAISLHPNLNDIEYIEVTGSLPVVAFGHLIPVFQPSEFSLPWSISDPVETAECSRKMKLFLSSI